MDVHLLDELDGKKKKRMKECESVCVGGGVKKGVNVRVVDACEKEEMCVCVSEGASVCVCVCICACVCV